MPMPPIQTNYSLLPYNTFGIDVQARHFAEITAASQLLDLAASPVWNNQKFVLGGGSNILLLNDVEGLVIYMNNKGIKTIKEDDEYVWLKVASGENWHEFVLHCIENDWGGVENLSLIPGSVGAAPMQNIGAYGVELEQVFVELDAFHIEEEEWHNFPNELCEFGYRTSVFKTTHKNAYIISSVTFKLTKTNHTLNTSYGAIQKTLEANNITAPTIRDISDAVIHIRQSKLPDPKEIGNSGSFFKNPIIENKQLFQLLVDYPEMPYYKVTETTSKVPAGWLIEQCGWKGKKVGNTGTHHAQALVLVNHGHATGQEVLDHAQTIIQSVNVQFDIKLQPEVNLVG